MKALVTSLIAGCLLVINLSFAQWEWQSPQPQGNLLYKVQFINSSVGWAVGDYGTILHTSDSGLQWVEQEYGRTDNILGLKMFSQSTGCAVGDNGTILRTTNGGNDWLEQISGTAEGLNSLFFLDSLNGWVVGDKELILHTTNGGTTWEFQQQLASQYSINTIAFSSATEGWAAGGNRRVYHTTNAGVTWNYQMIGPSMTAHLHIYFVNALLGFIVGTDGSILRTDDGGAMWSQVPTGDNVNYNQVIMQNTLVGWIAGDGGRILRTLNGGASWSTTILSEGMDLNGITRYSGTGTLWMVGEFGKILRSSNNGVSWSSLDSGSRLSVNWIDFSSATNGIGVGQTGLIMRTTDGGTSWTESTSPTPSISMFGIDMVDGRHGWAVGDEATILYTIDGTTWSPQSNPATGNVLFGVSFSGTQNGWIAGGEYVGNTGLILHTTDGGSNWNTQLNTSSVIFGICFKDNLNGWAIGGNGTILHTTNSGINWNPQTSIVTSALYWCSFSDLLNGWIVGDGGIILHTTDGGNVWTTQNSGVNDNLYSIAIDGNLIATIAGDEGTILHTSDGGTNWEKEYSRTNYGLFGIAHSTDTWVCGDYGTILKYKAPIVYGSVTGRIINDINNNGAPDIDEPGLAGWRVQITGPETMTTYSSADGSFTFSEITLGTYTLTQELLPAWSQTMPVSPAGYSFTLSTSEPNFIGNFCNYTPFTSSFSVESGWNVLSCPVHLDDPRVTSIYPSALSSAFLYGYGYMESDSVPEAVGFWMKFPDALTQWIAGVPILNDTIPLQAGWNIIGSVSDSTDTSAIISVPPNIIVSDYFGYNQSYYQSQSIQPGKGYWVKAAETGIIILNGGARSSANAGKSAGEVTAHLNNITITDASGRKSTLYFGPDKECQIDPLHYELPPLPPEECFDVRFRNGGSVYLFSGRTEKRASIEMQSVHYPIRISWNIQSADHAQYKIVDSGKDNKTLSELTGSGSLMLPSLENQTLLLTMSGVGESGNIPAEFALMQNSPNPFNPSTTIRFMLPLKSHVHMEIFSIIGQRVGMLIDEVRDAGTYSIDWSPATIAGGMYFYRLDANPVDQPGKHFVLIKKMVLLK